MTGKNLRSVYALGLAGLMAFASCDKVKDAIKVTVGATSSDITFTIPVLEQTGDATLGASQVRLNIDSIIKSKDSRVGAKNIKSVTITRCTITMLDGDTANNFSALESCRVQLSSDVKPDVVTIAEITDNPDAEAYTLEIPVTNTELTGYFNSTYFNYTVSGKARKTTSKPLQCQATVSYDITAGL